MMKSMFSVATSSAVSGTPPVVSNTSPTVSNTVSSHSINLSVLIVQPPTFIQPPVTTHVTLSTHGAAPYYTASRLPKLTIPKFNGDTLPWHQFNSPTRDSSLTAGCTIELDSKGISLTTEGASPRGCVELTVVGDPETLATSVVGSDHKFVCYE